MKAQTKVVLLVAVVLLLAISACTRQATPKTTAENPTPTGEVEFPFTTPVEGAISDFGTQTAIARTPQVVIATETPAAEQVEPGAEGGQGEQPAAPSPDEAGGGIEEPAGPAAEAVPTPALERPSTYTLQKGEWPICIARRFDLDIPTFFAANGLNMNSKPAAGVTLQIPSSGTWNPVYGSRTLAAHPTDYTVQANESVYSIACKFGDVSPEAILAVNGLSSASDVQPGMTIRIP